MRHIPSCSHCSDLLGQEADCHDPGNCPKSQMVQNYGQHCSSGSMAPGTLANGLVSFLSSERQMKISKQIQEVQVDGVPTVDSVAMIVYGFQIRMAGGRIMRNIVSYQPAIQHILLLNQNEILRECFSGKMLKFSEYQGNMGIAQLGAHIIRQATPKGTLKLGKFEILKFKKKFGN